VPRPSYDDELKVILAEMSFPPKIDRKILPDIRAFMDEGNAKVFQAQFPITLQNQIIPGLYGKITMSIIKFREPKSLGRKCPGIFHIHGGGMISGN
jgi:hypothetical protein